MQEIGTYSKVCFQKEVIPSSMLVLDDWMFPLGLDQDTIFIGFTLKNQILAYSEK